MRNFLFILLITLSASRVGSLSARNYFIVWNVGQGQWATYVTALSCWHFDVGGEFFPRRRIERICAHKEQKIFLSHWDWDHVGGLRLLPSEACMAARPLGKSSVKKENLVGRFKTCANSVKDVMSWVPRLAPGGSSTRKTNSNDKSQVFQISRILVPGDSPLAAETFWQEALPLKSVEILLLGHHGSKTSTGRELLQHLPRLRMAVSSARSARYRHPHPEVQSRLREARVPLLRTEDWGSLWFEMPVR